MDMGEKGTGGGGWGAGRGAVLELHTLSLIVSYLPVKMNSFDKTEVLTSSGGLDWMI